MQQFLQKYGRALDISGAFLFAVIGAFAAYSGLHILALAFWIGAIAFFASWRAWGYRNTDPVEHRFNRTMCAIMIVLSFVSFVLAIIFEVLS